MCPFLKVLPLILAFTLLHCPQSQAAFVVPRLTSAYPSNDTLHTYKTHDESSFLALYPGRKKRVAIWLALPFVSMLGLYGFYLGPNRIGLGHIAFDFLGASFVYWYYITAGGILKSLVMIFFLRSGVVMLLASFAIGIFALYHILHNLPITRFDYDHY